MKTFFGSLPKKKVAIARPISGKKLQQLRNTCTEFCLLIVGAVYRSTTTRQQTVFFLEE